MDVTFFEILQMKEWYDSTMKKKQPDTNPRNSKPISLYPMKPEEAIRRALNAPLHRPQPKKPTN